MFERFFNTLSGKIGQKKKKVGDLETSKEKNKNIKFNKWKNKNKYLGNNKIKEY